MVLAEKPKFVPLKCLKFDFVLSIKPRTHADKALLCCELIGHSDRHPEPSPERLPALRLLESTNKSLSRTPSISVFFPKLTRLLFGFQLVTFNSPGRKHKSSFLYIPLLFFCFWKPTQITDVFPNNCRHRWKESGGEAPPGPPGPGVLLWPTWIPAALLVSPPAQVKVSVPHIPYSGELTNKNKIIYRPVNRTS